MQTSPSTACGGWGRHSSNLHLGLVSETNIPPVKPAQTEQSTTPSVLPREREGRESDTGLRGHRGRLENLRRAPKAPTSSRLLPQAETLSSLSHQSAQGRPLPPGSAEAPLSGPEAVAEASTLSRDPNPNAGVGALRQPREAAGSPGTTPGEGSWPFCRLWLCFILIHACVYLTSDTHPRACKSNKFLAPASFFKKYKRGSHIKKLINIHPAKTAWNICVLSSFIKLHQSVF